MKLLYKNALVMLLVMLPFGLLGGWLLHKLVEKAIVQDVDEQLNRRLNHLKERWERTPNQPLQALGLDSDIEIELVASPQVQWLPVYQTEVRHGRNRQLLKTRTLTAIINIQGRYYQVILKEIYDELNNLTWNISTSVVLAYWALLLLTALIILLLSRRLWKPFYNLLEEVKTYRFDRPRPLTAPASNTAEFNELSRTLLAFTDYAASQYISQRQFSENASHEIQTPLSIALGNLNALMQADYIQQKELLYIYQTKETLQRLSNLSQGLLLLTKIENRQFRPDNVVNITELLEELVQSYSEFAQHQHLRFDTTLAQDVFLYGDAYLLEILFSNLIKNAVRHNIANGQITLQLTGQKFMIQNSGIPLPFPSSQIFDRFVKNPVNQESTGLGLSMVRQIATLHHMRIEYYFLSASNEHRFQLHFDEAFKKTEAKSEEIFRQV